MAVANEGSNQISKLEKPEQIYYPHFYRTTGEPHKEELKWRKTLSGESKMDVFEVLDKLTEGGENSQGLDNAKMSWMLDTGYLARKKAKKIRKIPFREQNCPDNLEIQSNKPAIWLPESLQLHPDVSRTPQQDHEFGIVPKMGPEGTEYLSTEAKANIAATKARILKARQEADIFCQQQQQARLQRQIQGDMRSHGGYQQYYNGNYEQQRHAQWPPQYNMYTTRMYMPNDDQNRQIPNAFGQQRSSYFQPRMGREYSRQPNGDFHAQIQRDSRQVQIPRTGCLPVFEQLVPQEHQIGYCPSPAHSQKFQNSGSLLRAPRGMQIQPPQQNMSWNNLMRSNLQIPLGKSQCQPSGFPGYAVPQVHPVQQCSVDVGNNLYENLQHTENVFTPVFGEPSLQVRQNGVTSNDSKYQNHQPEALPKLSTPVNDACAPVKSDQQFLPTPAPVGGMSSILKSAAQKPSSPWTCVYCESIRMPPCKFTSHPMCNPTTNEVTCRELRKRVCVYCGATGPRAHRNYDCPHPNNPRIAAEMRAQNQINLLQSNELMNGKVNTNQENTKDENKP